MYLPFNNIVTQMDVAVAAKDLKNNEIGRSSISLAIEKRIIQSVRVYFQTLDEEIDTVSKLCGTLSFKISKQDDCVVLIEGIFEVVPTKEKQ